MMFLQDHMPQSAHARFLPVQNGTFQQDNTADEQSRPSKFSFAIFHLGIF